MAASLELLSPAGTADIGMAAIDHGADAVYIGAPMFGARADARADLADISRLIQHAHLYYAKVYVALNTILTDAELPESLEIIQEVFRLGADGLIIQDVGLLELNLPPIPLIASTQMHNNTVEKVQFLERVGFTRVILARELSLREIAAIRKKTKVELEVFVHGALCVAYSGQCYMSQVATGRSGNRGICAQPCRSRYTLTDGSGKVIRKDKFLLSLKDLNRITAVPDLIASGVTSFKIEGRYKGIDYVKNVTAAYREAIDEFIARHPDYHRSSSGVSTPSFSPDLSRTFNRGYTNYFVLGRANGKIASIDTQKSVGQPLGTITGIGTGFFRMDKGDLLNGDGLCYFTSRHDLAGFRVNRVEGDRIYPNTMKGLKAGTFLYRNHDAALTRTLSRTSAERRLAVKMDFTQEEDSIRLAVTDEDGNRTERTVAIHVEPSKDPSRTRDQIEKQLASTGNTPYRVTKLTIQPQQPGFVPVSTLNGLRRDALESLTRIRFDNYVRQTIVFVPNDTPYPEKRLDFRSNVLNEYAHRFYERHGVESIDPALETLSNPVGKAVMATRYCIRDQLDLCPNQNHHAKKLPAQSLTISDGNHTYRLEFDCRRCRMSVILEK